MREPPVERRDEPRSLGSDAVTSEKRRPKPRPSARDALINAFRDLTGDEEFLDWFEKSLEEQGFVIAEKSW